MTLIVLRLVVAGIFLWAGGAKLADPAAFAAEVDRYQLLPWLGTVALSILLPWLELFCGLALLFRRLYRGALWLLFLCSIVFLYALGTAWWSGLDIACGCFGPDSVRTPLAALVLDAALFFALLALLIADRDSVYPDVRRMEYVRFPI